MRCEKDAKEPFGFVCVVASDRDRPIEVDPSAFLETISSGKYGPLQHRVREALKTQAAHREKLAGGAGGAGGGRERVRVEAGEKKSGGGRRRRRSPRAARASGRRGRRSEAEAKRRRGRGSHVRTFAHARVVSSWSAC